ACADRFSLVVICSISDMVGNTGSTTSGSSTNGGTTSGPIHEGPFVCGPGSTFVVAPAFIGSNTACLACESDPNSCPDLLDACNSTSDPDACNAVLACARRTDCATNSVNDCLCGNGDLGACGAGQAAGLLGPCVAEIRAGLPGIPDPLLLGS